MRRIIVFGLILLLVTLAASACSKPDQTIDKTDEQVIALTATAQANIDGVPSDVPIHEGAVKLKFAAGNTYITYEVFGDVDTIVEYYRTELELRGWEKRNNNTETPIGGALTILRSKPDKNISVTIQSIPGSENSRVLITVIGR